MTFSKDTKRQIISHCVMFCIGIGLLNLLIILLGVLFSDYLLLIPVNLIAILFFCFSFRLVRTEAMQELQLDQESFQLRNARFGFSVGDLCLEYERIKEIKCKRYGFLNHKAMVLFCDQKTPPIIISDQFINADKLWATLCEKIRAKNQDVLIDSGVYSHIEKHEKR